MKYCSNCGESTNDDGNIFCGNCGHSIWGEEKTAENVGATGASETAGATEPVDAMEPVEGPVEESADVPTEDQTAEDPTAEPTAEEPTVEPAEDTEGAPEAQAAAAAEPQAEAEVETDSAPKKPSSTALKAAIACIVGIVVLGSALAMALVSGVFAANPVDRFVEIQQQSIFGPLADALTIVEDDQESFSTDIIITAGIESNDFMMAMVSSVLDQFAIEIGIDLDVNNAESMVGLGLTAFGEEFISAAIVATEELLGLYIPTIGAYYTIDLDTIEGLFGLLGDEFIAAFESQMAWTGDEYGEMVRRYGDIILSAVNSSNLEETRETLSLFDGREEVDATVYTFTPGVAGLRELLTALIQEIRDDEVIYSLWAQQQSEWMIGRRGYDSAREYWDSIFDEAETEIRGAAIGLAAGNFTWRSALVGRQLVLQEISFESNDVSFTLRYEGYANGNDRTDWFTFEFSDRWYDGNMLSFRNDLTTNRDSVEGTLTMYLRDEWTRGSGRAMVATYDLDLGTTSILEIPYGRYEVEIFDGWDDPIVNFSLVVSAGRGGGTDHLLTIYGMEEFGLTSITVNMHSTDAPSTITQPTQRPVDLSGLSPEAILDTLDDLLWELERHLGGLVDGLFGALAGF